jgi:hypothetical protein
MSFRIRRGRASFSLGPRGPRANYRLGCLVPMASLAAIALVLAACRSVATPVPTFTPAPPPTSPTAKYECPPTRPWLPTTPLGQGILVERDRIDAQHDVVAPRGLFILSGQLGDPRGYVSSAEADAIAKNAVQETNAAHTRWIVLGRSNGYFPYVADQFDPNVDLLLVMDEPGVPCVVPASDATFWGYHAIGLVGFGDSQRWIRWDENAVDGASAAVVP